MERTMTKTGGVAAAAMLLVTACGGDDATAVPEPDTTATPAAQPTAAAERVSETQAASGPGTATLTVGDESYSMAGVACKFTPEEARSETTSFALGVSGTVDGKRAQMTAYIEDPEEQGRYEGDGVAYTIEVSDQDFAEQAFHWRAHTGGEFGPEATWTIVIDGKRVSAEPEFDDSNTDEREAITGTFEATCP